MNCGSVMSHPLVVVPCGATASDAAQQMRDGRFGFIAVQSAEGQLVGVLTDRDLAVRVCARGLAAEATSVESVMSSPPVSCRTRDPVEQAETLMMEHQIQRLVVLEDDGSPAGLLSLSDLAQCAPPLDLARLVRQVTAREFRYKGRVAPESRP
ncbi:MAG: CBS domain-containing protein [Polyangiaceae bacterium]